MRPAPPPPSPLRLARQRLGFTLEQAAVAARISSGWLRLVERDPTLLSKRVAERLLPVLRLRPEDLLEPATPGADADGQAQP